MARTPTGPAAAGFLLRTRWAVPGGATVTPPDEETPPTDDLLLSSSDELDTPSRLLLSGDAQVTGTDALAL